MGEKSNMDQKASTEEKSKISEEDIAKPEEKMEPLNDQKREKERDKKSEVSASSHSNESSLKKQELVDQNDIESKDKTEGIVESQMTQEVEKQAKGEIAEVAEQQKEVKDAQTDQLHSQEPKILGSEKSNSSNQSSSVEMESKIKKETDEVKHRSESVQSNAENREHRITETKSKDKLNEFLLTAQKVDKINLLDEQAEYQAALVRYIEWNDKYQGLVNAVIQMQSSFREKMENFSSLNESLNSEIRDALSSRSQGVALCGKMMDRVASKMDVDAFKSAIDGEFSFESIDLASLLRELTIMETQEQETHLKHLLKQRRIKNNQIIATAFKQAEGVEKLFLSSIERQILPILDGLDEGKRISVTTIRELEEKYFDQKQQLAQWYEVYDHLINEIEHNFELLGVRSIQANRGEDINYELYEPFDVEEDPDLQDEQVKETIRRGTILVNEEGEFKQTIRPGQVIVVKNPGQEQ